jgi:hypothetical protein
VLQNRCGLTFSNWNDAGYQPAMLGHVDDLAMPHPRQHFAGVVA